MHEKFLASFLSSLIVHTFFKALCSSHIFSYIIIKEEERVEKQEGEEVMGSQDSVGEEVFTRKLNHNSS